MYSHTNDILLHNTQEFWFWECVVISNKCLLTGVLTIIAPGSPLQLLAALLICTAYLLSVFKFDPYIGRTSDKLASLTSGSLFATYLIGFYESTAKYYKESSGSTTGDSETAIRLDILGPVLIAINTAPLVYFVVSNLWYAAVVAPAENKKSKIQLSSVIPVTQTAELNPGSEKMKVEKERQFSVTPAGRAAEMSEGKKGSLAGSSSTAAEQSASEIRSWESWG